MKVWLNEEERKKYKGKLLLNNEIKELEKGIYMVGKDSNQIYMKLDGSKVINLADKKERNVKCLLLCKYLGPENYEIEAEDW